MKLINTIILILLSYTTYSQTLEVGNEFEGISNVNVTQGGSFDIKNSPKNISKYYQDFMKPYIERRDKSSRMKVKGNIYSCGVFDGNVTTTIKGNDFNTNVEIQVINCPLPNLALKFRCYCIRAMLSDTANRLKSKLDDIIDRETALRKKNVKLIDKIKELKNEIANCEIMYRRNEISIGEYVNNIEPKYEATIAEINRKMVALQEFINDIDKP